MMRYTVYTPDGEYRDVASWSADGAKMKIFRLVLGRVPMNRMTVIRTA